MRNLPPASRFPHIDCRARMRCGNVRALARSSLAQTSLHEPYYGSDCALLAEMALLGKFVSVPSAILYSRDHPTRSVNLHSSERLLWHNQDASGSNPFELSSRLRHLVVIAYRHRRQAPVHHSLCHLRFGCWILPDRPACPGGRRRLFTSASRQTPRHRVARLKVDTGFLEPAVKTNMNKAAPHFPTDEDYPTALPGDSAHDCGAKNLVIVRAGRNSLHAGWTAGTGEAEFDLLVAAL